VNTIRLVQARTSPRIWGAFKGLTSKKSHASIRDPGF